MQLLKIEPGPWREGRFSRDDSKPLSARETRYTDRDSRVPHSFALFANEWVSSQSDCKLGYMHRNPVKCGLVESPDHGSRAALEPYFYGEPGLVQVSCQE